MKISTKWKFLIQILLTFFFFICEFITAQVTDSDTILADAFHMFSDFIALALGLYCSELTKLSRTNFESSSSLENNSKNINKKFTFGYERAEIVGAFANSVFLAALTFDIVLDAIDRFILVPTQIKNPQLLVAVGILGLVINICGLIMFCGCGTVRSKILVRLRNLVIFEVFGVKFSAKNLFSKLPQKRMKCMMHIQVYLVYV